ncbi:glutathione S-transferase family protein [Roseibium sp.]|uniref:glutathione S-transferase family protein n=1 Tax=Roseibium sp. TaxID=1936156 RepID=UPI003A987825
MTDVFAPDEDRLCLYGSFDSANLIVRFVLEELQADYRFIEVNRASRLNRSEAYLKLNPQGLLPVLTVPDQAEPLFETAAILLFIGDRAGRLVPAPQSPMRGRLLTWLFFISNTLHSDMRISFRPKRYLAEGADEAPLRQGLEARIGAGFDYLERCISDAKGPFLLADDLSILDFYAAACARWFQLYPYVREFRQERWPHLRAMLMRLEERPSVRRAAEAEMITGPVFVNPSRPNIDPATITGV